jgi:hypothetical protein
MAYDKQKLIEQAIEAIKKYNLIFVDDVISMLPISKQTFYTYKFDHNDDIKKLLEKNKVSIKNGLRKRWYEKPNPITDIALYKLTGTSDERDALNNAKQKLDVTTGGDKLSKIEIVIVNEKKKTQ